MISHIVGTLSELVSRFVGALTSISLKLQDALVPVVDVSRFLVTRQCYEITCATITATGWVYFYNNSNKVMSVHLLRIAKDSGTLTFSNEGIANLASSGSLYSVQTWTHGAETDTNNLADAEVGNFYKVWTNGNIHIDPDHALILYIGTYTAPGTVTAYLYVEEWETRNVG